MVECPYVAAPMTGGASRSRAKGDGRSTLRLVAQERPALQWYCALMTDLKHKSLIITLLLLATGVYSLRFVHYFTPPGHIALFYEDSIHVYAFGDRAINFRVIHGAGTNSWENRYLTQLSCPGLFRIDWFDHPAPHSVLQGTIYVRPTLVLLLAYPTFALIHSEIRRRSRHRKGHCLSCGYDLTGNCSGQCPECGVRAPL